MSAHSCGVDVAVHVEGEVRERSEAAGVEVAALQVADELLLPLLHRGVGRPDALQLGERVVVESARVARRAAASATSRASSTRSRRRSRAAASRARHTSRAPAGSARRSAPSAHGSRTRAVSSSFSATGSSRRSSSGFALWMRTSGKPSFFAPSNMSSRELELLVGRHVAVAAPAHVEVRAERAGVESVAVERRAPGAHELVR